MYMYDTRNIYCNVWYMTYMIHRIQYIYIYIIQYVRWYIYIYIYNILQFWWYMHLCMYIHMYIYIYICTHREDRGRGRESYWDWCMYVYIYVYIHENNHFDLQLSGWLYAKGSTTTRGPLPSLLKLVPLLRYSLNCPCESDMWNQVELDEGTFFQTSDGHLDIWICYSNISNNLNYHMYIYICKK